MATAKAFAASAATSPLAGTNIPRRDVLPDDVEFDIAFCGVCHSDLHAARNEWAVWPTVYPCVPGHEIVGKVTKVGSKVTKFKVGDVVATGCMVDSCQKCGSCKEGLEQYCDNGATVFTYNSPDPHKTAPTTYGGYSERIVVNEKFVLRVPKNLDLAATAPLLCAGITLYSPLRHWGARAGEEGRHCRAWRPRAHGGEVLPCVRRRRCCLQLLPTRLPMGNGWEPMTWSFRRTRTR